MRVWELVLFFHFKFNEWICNKNSMYNKQFICVEKIPIKFGPSTCNSTTIRMRRRCQRWFFWCALKRRNQAIPLTEFEKWSRKWCLRLQTMAFFRNGQWADYWEITRWTGSPWVSSRTHNHSPGMFVAIVVITLLIGPSVWSFCFDVRSNAFCMCGTMCENELNIQAMKTFFDVRSVNFHRFAKPTKKKCIAIEALLLIVSVVCLPIQ